MEKPVLQIQVFVSPHDTNDFLKHNPKWWFVQAVVVGTTMHCIVGTDTLAA